MEGVGWGEGGREREREMNRNRNLKIHIAQFLETWPYTYTNLYQVSNHQNHHASQGNIYRNPLAVEISLTLTYIYLLGSHSHIKAHHPLVPANIADAARLAASRCFLSSGSLLPLPVPSPPLVGVELRGLGGMGWLIENLIRKISILLILCNSPKKLLYTSVRGKYWGTTHQYNIQASLHSNLCLRVCGQVYICTVYLTHTNKHGQALH